MSTRHTTFCYRLILFAGIPLIFGIFIASHRTKVGVRLLTLPFVLIRFVRVSFSFKLFLEGQSLLSVSFAASFFRCTIKRLVLKVWICARVFLSSLGKFFLISFSSSQFGSCVFLREADLENVTFSFQRVIFIPLDTLLLFIPCLGSVIS